MLNIGKIRGAEVYIDRLIGKTLLEDRNQINTLISKCFKGSRFILPSNALPSNQINEIEYIDDTPKVSYQTLGNVVKILTSKFYFRLGENQVYEKPMFSIKGYIIRKKNKTLCVKDDELFDEINSLITDEDCVTPTKQKIYDLFDIAIKDIALFEKSLTKDVIPILGYGMKRDAELWNSETGKSEPVQFVFEVFPYLEDPTLDYWMTFCHKNISKLEKRLEEKGDWTEYEEMNEQLVKQIAHFVAQHKADYNHRSWIEFSKQMREENGYSFLSGTEIGRISELAKSKYFSLGEKIYSEMMSNGSLHNILKNETYIDGTHFNSLTSRIKESRKDESNLNLYKKKKDEIILSVIDRVASFNTRWTASESEIIKKMNELKRKDIDYFCKKKKLDKKVKQQLYDDNEITSLSDDKEKMREHEGRIPRYLKNIVCWYLRDFFWDDSEKKFDTISINSFQLGKKIEEKLFGNADSEGKKKMSINDKIVSVLKDEENYVVSHEDFRPHHIFVRYINKEHQPSTVISRTPIFDLLSVERQRLGKDMVEILTSSFLKLDYNEIDRYLELFLDKYAKKQNKSFSDDERKEHMRAFYWLRIFSRLGKMGLTANTKMKNVKNIYKKKKLFDPDICVDEPETIDITVNQYSGIFKKYHANKLKELLESMLDPEKRKTLYYAFAPNSIDYKIVKETHDLLSNLERECKGEKIKIDLLEDKCGIYNEEKKDYNLFIPELEEVVLSPVTAEGYENGF